MLGQCNFSHETLLANERALGQNMFCMKCRQITGNQPPCHDVVRPIRDKWRLCCVDQQPTRMMRGPATVCLPTDGYWNVWPLKHSILPGNRICRTGLHKLSQTPELTSKNRTSKQKALRQFVSLKSPQSQSTFETWTVDRTHGADGWFSFNLNFLCKAHALSHPVAPYRILSCAKHFLLSLLLWHSVNLFFFVGLDKLLWPYWLTVFSMRLLYSYFKDPGIRVHVYIAV